MYASRLYALDTLTGLGRKVEDRKAILDQLLPDDYYLIHASARVTTANSCVRWARFPTATATTVSTGWPTARFASAVSRIMEERGGWRFIGVMSESKDAFGMAQAFSMGPGGRDFTRPTGRICIEQQLIERLKQAISAKVVAGFFWQ